MAKTSSKSDKRFKALYRIVQELFRNVSGFPTHEGGHELALIQQCSVDCSSCQFMTSCQKEGEGYAQFPLLHSELRFATVCYGSSAM